MLKIILEHCIIIFYFRNKGKYLSDSDKNWKIVLKYWKSKPEAGAGTDQYNSDQEYLGKVRSGCPGVYKKNGALYVMIGDKDVELKPTTFGTGPSAVTTYNATIGDKDNPIVWGVESISGINKIKAPTLNLLNQSQANTKTFDSLANWLQDYVEFSRYKDGTTEKSIIA